MGNYDLRKCIFTGLDACSIINDVDCIDYSVVVNKRRFSIQYRTRLFIGMKPQNSFGRISISFMDYFIIMIGSKTKVRT